MIRNLLTYLREAFPINRVVALLTPFVATGVGIVSAWLADHAPFIADQVSGDQLTAIALGGILATLTVAYKWLDGWQDYEDRLDR